ncbi:MAG: BamA/TamA family outer membrane protein [Bacteroidales bacterium]|nr:BamA/TamA family outer membrane protein [Bacteroidales bacterium]
MNGKNLILTALAGLLVLSCSTTRVLPQGKYRLAGNKVKVEGKEVRSADLTSYLTQKPNTTILGYSPGVALYNWADTADTWWNNFIRSLGAPPVIYDPRQVNASSENIRNHLEYIGYFGSDVRAEVRYKKKRAYVTYYVRPGNQYTIRSINYELPDNEEFRREFETDLRRTTIKEGQFLSESSLEAETVRSAEFFRNRGYYGFDKSFYFCEADTLSHDGTAALTMAIREYPRNGDPEDAKPFRKYSIGKVTMSYPKETPIRTYVLEELNVLRPGMPYSERAVNATYSRLLNLNVFNNVNVTMNPVADDVVDCDINLLAGGVQGFKANIEGSVNSTGLFGISPQLNYFHKNFFHGGELLNLGLKGNFQFKPKDDVRATEFSITSTLRIPKLIGLPNSLFRGPNLPHTDLSLGFSYQDRPEYKRLMITTSFGYTGNIGRNFYYQFYPFQANIVRLFSVSESFEERLLEDLFMLNAYSDHFDVGVGGMLYYTTDASAIPKRSYRYGRLNFDLSGNVMSLFNSAMPTDPVTGQHTIWNVPYAQYVRGELQLGQTIRLGGGEGQAVALRFLIGAGYGYGNSTTVPFEKQFYAGGASSMRGWQARALGPGGVEPWTEYFLIPSQTGDFKMEANIEYRFPIVWKLEGALFADMGNVWELRKSEWFSNSSFSFDTIAADWGLGIRVNLDFILVRIDMGTKVYEPCRPADERLIGPAEWLKRDNFALHFGVGYPF